MPTDAVQSNNSRSFGVKMIMSKTYLCAVWLLSAQFPLLKSSKMQGGAFEDG